MQITQYLYSLVLLFLFNSLNSQTIDDFKLNIQNPNADSFALEIQALGDDGQINNNINGQFDFVINKSDQKINFKQGKAIVNKAVGEIPYLYIKQARKPGKLNRIHINDNKVSLTNIPLWMSMIPPFVAIILALLLKEVLISLFVGIWAGAFILNGFSLSGLLSSLYTVIDKYIVGALADTDHLAVVIFSLMIGGMVAIISRNGGMRGVVDKLSIFANNARNAQFVTWFLGVAIFFDDYANTLIVGNTMRPVTDKFKISREKLAYLVDSTAAPIAAIAFVTTWIGAELGYIAEAVESLGLEESPYSLFLHSLQYSYYPVLTLVFGFLLIYLNKDYGAMVKAETRARTTGQLYDQSTDRGENEVDNSLEELDPVPGIEFKWYNAFIPVMIVVTGTIIGLFYTGHSPGVWDNPELGLMGKLSKVIGDSNSYAALLWSSISAVIAAIILTVGGRYMSLKSTMETFTDGLKTMLPAILILVMAWALGQITKDLYTADFLTDILDGFLSPYWIPAVTFILAGLIAFSTGSSWSTMAILYPLILPATWTISMGAGMEVTEIMPIFYNVTSCVLAGAVFGDHCSPISDTTILSSLASSCNHLDHVKTQLPYALTVGAISVLLGILSMQIPIPTFIWFLIGGAMIYLIIRFLGTDIPTGEMKAENE